MIRDLGCDEARIQNALSDTYKSMAQLDARKPATTSWMKFSGKFRKIDKKDKEALMTFSGITKEVVIDEEILLLDDGGEYWIPIQKVIKDSFIKYAEIGEPTLASIRNIGCRSTLNGSKIKLIHFLTQLTTRN